MTESGIPWRCLSTPSTHRGRDRPETREGVSQSSRPNASRSFSAFPVEFDSRTAACKFRVKVPFVRHAGLKVNSKWPQNIEESAIAGLMGCPWLGDVVESAIQTCPFLKQVASTHSEVSNYISSQSATKLHFASWPQSAINSSSVSVALRAAACHSVVPWCCQPHSCSSFYDKLTLSREVSLS